MTNVYWPSVTSPDTLGPLLGADDIRFAMYQVINKWSPYYIGVLSERLYAQGRIGNKNPNPNPLPNFGKWLTESSFRSIGSGQPASYAIRVIDANDTRVQANGRVAAKYRATITVQTFGTVWFEAADLTSWYEKVIRWCLLHNRSLGGLANSTKWMSTEYAGIEHSSTRTEGQALMVFEVALLNTLDVSATPGVGTPPVPPSPPSPDPTVATTVLELTKVPDTQNL